MLRWTGQECGGGEEEASCSSNSDEITSEPSGSALQIDLIVSTVLNFMTTSELLEYSLINKLWCHEARKILREKRRCFATMRAVYTCKDLKRFDEVLENSDPAELPYNGLYLPVDSDNHHEVCLRTLDEEQVRWIPHDVQYANVYNKLCLKYLHMEYMGDDYPMCTCPAVAFFPTMVTCNNRSLVEICKRNYPSPWDISEGEDDQEPRHAEGCEELGANLLPNLKIIRGKDVEIEEFMRPLCEWLARAPNLKEFLVVVTRNQFRRDYIEEFIPPERYGVIKSLCFECWDVLDVANFYLFASTDPRLRNLIIKYPIVYFPENGVHGEENVNVNEDEAGEGFYVFNEQFSWEALVGICRSSSETLQKLRLPATVAVELMNREWLEFPNVTSLVLEVPIDVMNEEQVLHRALRRFNFTARFPKLTAITVDDPPDNFYEPRPEFSQDSYELRADLPQDTTARITSLTLKNHVTEFALGYLATLFPHVKTLELSPGGWNKSIPFSPIWKGWPQLEQLIAHESCHVGITREGWINYDAEFLGVSEDEARLLREQPPELLSHLGIVPIRPALTTMTKLREFTVSFLAQHLDSDPFIYDSNFFLSRAACILSVNRMTNLNFRLLCHPGHGTETVRRVVPVTFHVNVERPPSVFEDGDAQEMDELQEVL